jgi:hypothetical protein
VKLSRHQVGRGALLALIVPAVLVACPSPLLFPK